MKNKFYIIIIFCSLLMASCSPKPNDVRTINQSAPIYPDYADQKGTIGNKVDTLWNARLTGKSVCFPKASPDGKYLLYTVADYGTFPIWHRETDLQLMNLQTGKTDDLKVVNSNRSDTYHSCSSNSHWFVFASNLYSFAKQTVFHLFQMHLRNY